jgi:hypothetical protein
LPCIEHLAVIGTYYAKLAAVGEGRPPVVTITLEKIVKARPFQAGAGMEGLDTAPTVHGDVGRCICYLVVGAKVVEPPFDAQALQSHRSP